ncbi:DUF5659 domain-containing protein [Paenibacillus silvisoli]|uniref:DUF5659 domain-containing protein n=1 Tax=Paenibacillus silvisoli TaxID=3110539 RepID=UPI003899668B
MRSQRLAGYLMHQGFKLHKMEVSNDGSNRNIFIFTHSQSLLDAVQDYKRLN